MNFDRQKRLVERLLDRTRAGELSWQESPVSNLFQVFFPNNSVQIVLLGLQSGPDYEIIILDSSGRITENFDDRQLDRSGAHSSGSWNSILGELFTSARRKALKADEAIDSILAEIG